MTLEELLVLREALSLTMRQTDIHKKAVEIVEREIHERRGLN